LAAIFGTEKSKREVLARVGSMTQVASIERYVMNQGRASGIKVIHVDAGQKLGFSILEDKALDIFRLCHKGINLGFISKPGLVSSVFYDPSGPEFTRTFQAGFLYTCGLANAGGPCKDGGVDYPFHGRIANTPSDNICVNAEWRNSEYRMEVSGEVREAALFGENIVLKRKISTSFGSNSLVIDDVVENQGFESKQIMLLYHMNIGYPMLDKAARFYVPAITTVSRNDIGKDLYDYGSFCDPADNREEQVLFHHLAGDINGIAGLAIFNSDLGFGIGFEYDLKQLPCLTQWKSMKTGDYALGIEPGNCHPDGRIVSREKNESDILGPGKSKTYSIKVSIIEDGDMLRGFLKKYGVNKAV
jgi:hypothetical protein